MRFIRSVDVGPTDSPSFVVFAIVDRFTYLVVTPSRYQLTQDCLLSRHDGPGLAGILMRQCHAGNVKTASFKQVS